MIEIVSLCPDIAQQLCRDITQDLPQYFGLPQINEHYAIGISSCTNLVAKIATEYVGLIALNFPYPNNMNIYWLAIFRNFHSQGIGSKLIQSAYDIAKEKRATTMTVETLAASQADANYLKTYQFYQHNGFYPLFDLKPQNYEFDMVYMIKNILSN
ncbi:MAG: N-acetyltransferase [Rickettsiaceae bacterium]|nr:MAG: N-acetyltransferase [Rickettsiaceae bacterium]